MRIEGRQREAGQALELAGRVPVEGLRTVVERGQGQQRQEDPGEAVAHDHEHAQQVEGVGEQDVEDERQAVVHGVQVRGEAVEDAAHRRGVEEGHCGLEGDAKQEVRRKQTVVCFSQNICSGRQKVAGNLKYTTQHVGKGHNDKVLTYTLIIDKNLTEACFEKKEEYPFKALTRYFVNRPRPSSLL